MSQIPKSLYAIANKYWLESTRYNPHYKIYKSKKVAEKNANKLKENLLNLYQGCIDAKKEYIKEFKAELTDGVKVVEYRLVEDEDNK